MKAILLIIMQYFMTLTDSELNRTLYCYIEYSKVLSLLLLCEKKVFTNWFSSRLSPFMQTRLLLKSLYIKYMGIQVTKERVRPTRISTHWGKVVFRVVIDWRERNLSVIWEVAHCSAYIIVHSHRTIYHHFSIFIILGAGQK